MNELKVEIDFDESSREWRKNKIHLGSGYFAYRCNYIHSNGKECNKPLEINQRPRYISHSFNNRMTKSDVYCKKHSYVIRNNKNIKNNE